MRWTAASTVLSLLACSSSPAAQPAPAPMANDTDALEALATYVLQADAGSEAADSLFATDAEVIADGLRRGGTPRFAGIEAGGQVALGSIRIDQSGNFAWATFDYRWLAADRVRFHEGRATLIFTRVAAREAGVWRIAHLHSSLQQ